MEPYAIIRTGSKQYSVSLGDVIEVEKLQASEDEEVVFDDVLFVRSEQGVQVGAEGCKVRGRMLGEVRGPKVIAFKYKRRKNYHRKVGHRQRYSQVKIEGIDYGA